jgi:hypothetical protein
MATKKHKSFISAPMGVKKVTDIAGIGPIYGQKLKQRGFKYAYILLGQFLLHEKKENLFLEWLMVNFKINKRCAKNCFNCLHDLVQL